MSLLKKKITTNARILNELLTKYRSTFFAFCELINNSIQAEAKNVEIYIDYNNKGLKSGLIKKILIKDDGIGVSLTDFENKILEVGTTVKKGGQGIGRFGALQIGELIKIETVAYDKVLKKFTKVRLPIDVKKIQRQQLGDIDFEVSEEILTSEKNSYYEVSISDLYQNMQQSIQKKNQLSKEFLPENFKQSIFARYPFEIFHNKVKFSINDEEIKKEDFILDQPIIWDKIFTNQRGVDRDVRFYFYNVKSPLNKVKVFLYIENAGLKTVAYEYTYFSDWYTPDLGTWFIYIDSEIFNSDLFRNIDFEDIGDHEFANIKVFIKDIINEFFKARNKKFENFVNDLENDIAYPLRNQNDLLATHDLLFKKVAFLIEEDYKLLHKQEKLREIIYPLIDNAIRNGQIENIFGKIIKLSNVSLEKFHALLDKTELDDIIHFSHLVADKIEFLDFLHDIVYGPVSKFLRERSQLHKIVEKHLWIFGENYSDTLKLWSDKKIGNILTEVHDQNLNYIPTKDDDNLIEGKGLNDITDLFFFNEKRLDGGKREIMVVELKSPSCSISQKELNQIDRYAYTIEENSALPNDKVKYKLVLISSKIGGFAQSKLDSARKKFDIPFLFDLKIKKDIEVYVMSWAELIEMNKRRLTYLNNILRIKDKDVKQKFEEEYSEIIDEKFSSALRRIPHKVHK